LLSPSVSDIQPAFENEEFIMMYQPQINMVNREVVGVEAPIRWVHPSKGGISLAVLYPLLKASKWRLFGISTIDLD
jgi:EAL domain-containing protein (putative c-di-GMP-specific phosphodiesterase class I)